jgi:anti-sigma regulatory factor (Ser/Thr protein kinase)
LAQGKRTKLVCMRVSRAFEPEAAQVGMARRFAASTLAEWGVEDGDVTLLVSELATNAVLHARSEFTVELALLQGRIRVEVRDGNPRLPSFAVVPADAYSGRGLTLVQNLADAWGVETLAGGGKAIWVEVALPGIANGSCAT